MSPLTVRRYRAERLLRRDFQALSSTVLAAVKGKLGTATSGLDQSDLEACYAAAWQGLYMAILDGQEIVNPAGWLVLVTHRRAIEEQRRGGRRSDAGLAGGHARERDFAAERDLAAELDDRERLRQLFEGLRGRLSAREREAAVLCYLQGLSRSQAAAQMGVSEARMRKLMEGQGPGREGVAGKVGALVQSIRDGDWCEEQGSLMRGLAFGVLDPDGERYRLALIHRRDCPACRAYVTSLRGLAAALPPVLAPWGVAAGAIARVGETGHGAGSAAGSSAGGAGAGAHAGGAVGGTLTSSGAGAAAGAGAGAAGAGAGSGMGWLLASGGLTAKLAAGCLLAVGLGAGCIALGVGESAPTQRPTHSAHEHAAGHLARAASKPTAGLVDTAAPVGARAAVSAGVSATSASASRAQREFGPEHGGDLATAATHDNSASVPARAQLASVSVAASPTGTGAGRHPSAPSRAGEIAAEREFAPG
jgi:RNA polymerase sigma factor (sigma-70 family)